MAKFYDQLNDKHVAFIKAQKMFFVATAPLSAQMPSWLAWLPRVDVEGAALERQVPAAPEPAGVR